MSRFARQRPLRVLAFLAAPLALTGCGGGPSGPSPSGRQLVASGSFTQLLGTAAARSLGFSHDVAFVPFSTETSGTLEVIVDWNLSADELEVLLFRGTCTLQRAVSDQCDQVAASGTAGAKPKQLVLTGAAAGSYTLGIANRGPNTESGSYQVYLTP